MRTLAALSLVFAFSIVIVGCKKDDFPTTMCLSEEGTHQDCGIACTISKSEDACKKWETMTIELCDKAGKQACEEICEGDKNEYACTKAKSME